MLQDDIINTFPEPDQKIIRDYLAMFYIARRQKGDAGGRNKLKYDPKEAERLGITYASLKNREYLKRRAQQKEDPKGESL